MNMIKHLGCDPELFLRHAATGKFISSVGLIGGSKHLPMDIGEGCSVQEDNVAVEFNTPPCQSAGDFITAIQYNLDYLKARAADLGLELCLIPSAKFDEDQLASPAAQEFGCEPDYCAWTGGKQNPRPNAADANLRSAGGHIHVETDMDCLEVIKAMDLFVGCPLVEKDTDVDRRKLYGKAGAFRKKSYGVEYRTPSNYWITSPDMIEWVWNQTEKALQFVQEGNVLTDEDGFLIQKCINESDLGALEQLKDKFGEVL